MFFNNLSKYNKNICLISETRTFTYEEVNESSERIKQFLPSEKKLIILKAKINVETIIGYLAFLKADYAFIILDSGIDSQLINGIIEAYQPHFIWEEKEKNLEYLIDFGDYGLREFNKEFYEINKNLTVMLSTSGTTGAPKMVKLTKNNLNENCKSIVEYLKIDSSHRVITNLPFYYSYGLSILNTHLSMGASLVVTDKSILSKEFWTAFNENEVTTLNGVPYNYEILRRIGIFKMQLPSLKYLTQAGGKLNKALVLEFSKWALDKNIDFYVMYGQTEASARIAYLAPTELMNKESSIGIPIPNGKLLIKDLQSSKYITESNIEGELIYEGPNVMMGYAESYKDLSTEDELKGVLHTGDIGKKDDEGFFYITGRLKRFIKIHGNRVGLDEVEHFLKIKHYNVLCTGVDNVLMIATMDNSRVEEIKKIIIKKYGFHHTVVKVKYINEFPISNSGKINYKELLKEFK